MPASSADPAQLRSTRLRQARRVAVSGIPDRNRPHGRQVNAEAGAGSAATKANYRGTTVTRTGAAVGGRAHEIAEQQLHPERRQALRPPQSRGRPRGSVRSSLIMELLEEWPKPAQAIFDLALLLLRECAAAGSDAEADNAGAASTPTAAAMMAAKSVSRTSDPSAGPAAGPAAT